MDVSGGARLSMVLLFSAVLTAAEPPARARAQCPNGMVSTWATQGHCCWPGQQWSGPAGRCVGAPQCPYNLLPAGDQCVPAVGTQTPALYGGATGAGATVLRPIWGLVIAGAISFGVAWLATPIVGAAVGSDGYEIGYLAIPVAGPWVCLGDCYDPDDYMAALVISGLLQAAGVTMFILGLVLRREVAMYAELERGVELAIEPWAVPSAEPAAGLSLRLSAF